MPASSCGWTKTVSVERGQRLSIAATGSWGICSNACPDGIANAATGPDGFQSHLTNASDPFPRADGTMEVGGFPILEGHLAALIGKLGDSEPFEVGASQTLVAESDGELSLMINDNDCSDNWGSLTVRVDIE